MISTRLGILVIVVALVFCSNFSMRSASNSRFEMYSVNAPRCEPVSDRTISFTLVTQLSADRLWMMEHHCKRYPHETSIAVWTNETLQETRDKLEDMNCNLDLLHVKVMNASLGAWNDYPVNGLRNMALESVRSSHIIYIDVDFWTSESLIDILMGNEETINALVKNPKQAIVIPAFQLFRQCREWKDCRNKNLPFMPYTKEDLMEMFKNKRGNVFDPTNRGGHGSTLYKQWMKQNSGALLDIPCLKSNRYEPFLVIRYCRDLPPFQKRFSGYGKNKMTWMMQLIRSGYTLSQLGGTYLVHYPHLDSASRQHWNEAPEQLKVFNEKVGSTQIRRPAESDKNLRLGSFKRGQVDQLFVEFRQWLEEEVPDQRKIKMCPEHQDDDAKLWVKSSG